MWVHRCLGPGPPRTGTRLRARPWAGAWLRSSLPRIPCAKRCRSVQTILQQGNQTVLQTPLNTPGTCSAVSLAYSAFLQCVPSSWLADCAGFYFGCCSSSCGLCSQIVPWPSYTCQCKNTLPSHCAPNKGGSYRNSCGGCLVPVASFNATPLFHSSSQFSTPSSLQ